MIFLGSLALALSLADKVGIKAQPSGFVKGERQIFLLRPLTMISQFDTMEAENFPGKRGLDMILTMDIGNGARKFVSQNQDRSQKGRTAAIFFCQFLIFLL